MRKINAFVGQVPQKFLQKKLSKVQLLVVAVISGSIGTYALINSFASQPSLIPGSAIGFDRIAIGTNADFSNPTQQSQHYQFVIVQSWKTDVLAQLKAANPNIKVLAYYNLTGMSYPDSTGKYSGCVDPTSAPEQYFLHNLSNQRFAFTNYPGIWAANQGNTAYQQACANHITADITAKGFDGAMLDDTNYSIKYHYTPSQVQEYPTDAQYGTATKSAIEYVGPKITDVGKLAIPNMGGTYAEFADFNDSLLPYVSGGLDEFFTAWPGGNIQPNANRARAMQSITTAESMGKFYLANTQGANAQDTRTALYGLASVMLVSNHYTTFGFTADNNYISDPPWLPEFDAAKNLGAPKANYYTTGSVQRRDFDNGTVLANPTSTTQSVNLGGTYSGSGLTNVTTVSMPAQTGLILQSTPPSSTIAHDGNVLLALANPGTPFAPTSFWNTSLPANIPANPNNDAYVNEIANQLCNATFQTTPVTGTCTKSNIASLNSSNWSAPLYVVPADQPLVPVTRVCGTTPNTAFNDSVAGGVPVPANAHGAGQTITPVTDTDQEVQIYQPSTDKLWEFWHFKKDDNGNWTACWGGAISNVSQSNGIFPNNLGATATSLPLLGGIPRVEEFQAGQINHVMGLSLMYNLTSGIPANIPGATKAFSWPATRNDGASTDTLAIPEGQRFRLNPNLDLNTLDLTPYAKTIAVAAQKYGFVVDDRAGTVNIRVTDPTTYIVAGLPNPYTSGPGVGGVGTSGLFGGVSSGQIMKNFPWDQLQALPFNYGQPVADTTKPTVSMTAPYSDMTVADQVPLAASASDDTGVTKVEFYIDGQLASTDTTYPYTGTWNATNAAGGAHTITAKAYDAAGNVGTSSNITVAVIANPPIAPAFPKDGNVELTLKNPGTPYASTSFWNTLLPGSTPLNPNNTTYVNNILSDLSHQNAGSAAVNNIRWSAPLYVVPANQPLVPVKPYCISGNIPGTGFTNGVLAGGIPIPANAHAAAGTDQHISIYQPSTDKLWEFWRLQKDNSGAWEACWGGRLDNVSQSDGIFPYPYGGWTTGLPLLGSIVRTEELQAGHIDHVIGLGLPNNLIHTLAPANITGATNGISWPANRSDGTSTDPLAIPEGQRFRLPSNLDLNQYNLSPAAKMIAVAAQKYGFVVAYTGSVSIALGDPTTYTAAGYADPYISIYGSNYSNQGTIMQNFPWDKLQALPFDYGKPVPPPPSDTTAPNAPAGLSATAPNSTTVNLSWNASTDTGANQTGVTKYNVLRNGVVIAQPTTTSYTDTNRTSSTAYSYTVQAIDGAGNASANSNTASVTTPGVVDTIPPTVPTNLTATAVSINQVNLSWSISTDTGGSGIAGYNIYRNGTKLNSGLVTTASYGDSTANNSTTYTYKVEAVDGSGNKSAQTNASSATTPPVIRGDVTGPAQAPDGKINLQDISYEIRKYNTSDSAADISGPSNKPDGKVDIYDMSYIIRNYGG